MKKHLFWLVELFIWILILSLISSAIMMAKYNYKQKFNTYQIFLPDVDGMINGSPVKLMGIQIGYVNQLDIVGDDVYVRFVITEPNVKIPHGSIATVEFSGLGGSKSLELYPPKSSKDMSGKILVAQQPKRIHDSFGLLNDMFDQFSDLAYSVSHFVDNVGMIKEQKSYNVVVPAKTADEFIAFSNAWLNKAQKQCDKFGNKLEKIKQSKNQKKLECFEENVQKDGVKDGGKDFGKNKQR